MTITVDAELEEVLRRQAERLGITPEQFAIDTLRRRLVNAYLPPPEDEWHRRLREAAVARVVPAPGTTYSSDEVYDE